MTLSQATKKLILNEPYYGFVLMGLNKSFSDSVPTACVTVHNLAYELLVNKNYWDSISEEVQIQLLKHEMLHLCFFHLCLWGDFKDHDLFNIAADAEVNQYLDSSIVPEDWVNIFRWFPDAKQRAGVHYYYDLLKKNAQPYPKIVNHNWDNCEDLSQAEKDILKEQTDFILRTAYEHTQKSRGTVPAELEDYINKLMTQKPQIFNWKSYVRRLIGNSRGFDHRNSRMRPSKRFPDACGKRILKLADILVGIDTSGSVSSQELADFMTEIKHLYDAGVHVTIVECDADIHRVYEYTGKFDGKITGRGGTDFEPVADYYNKRRRQFQTLVFFTDGYSSLNFKVNGPAIWIITSEGSKVEDSSFPGLPSRVVRIPKDH